MKNNYKFILLLGLIFFSYSAQAIDIEQVIKTSLMPAADVLAAKAVFWLSIFIGGQFVLTNFGLLKSGADIEAVWGKFIGSILWGAFCFYLLENGPDYIGKVGEQFLNLFGVSLPNKGAILAGTLTPGVLLMGAGIFVGGIGAVGSVVGGHILTGLAFLIISMGFYFIIKLFMLKLELLIVVILSPLSFSFLGLNALKDQGIAPLKSLISLIYRIVLITVILSAFTQMSGILTSTISDGSSKLMSVANIADTINPFGNAYGVADLISDVAAVLFGYVVLTYLLYKSDSIAASLAGGSTNMGAGDVASAAAAGAALGAAAGAGGAAASDTATKGGQSMSDFMKSLNSSSVSNDSPKGAGGAEQKPVGTAPPPPPRATEMSLAQMRSHPSAIGNQAKNTSGSATTPATSGSGSASPGPSSPPSSNNSGSAGATKAANTIDNMAASGQIQNTDTAKHVSDHLKSMGSSPGDAKAVGEAPSKVSAPDAGSGSSAGIGGASSATDQKLDKLMESMAQPNKPGFKDRLANANDHVAKEQAATVVSINTHHTD